MMPTRTFWIRRLETSELLGPFAREELESNVRSGCITWEDEALEAHGQPGEVVKDSKDWVPLRGLLTGGPGPPKTVSQCPYCGNQYPDETTVCPLDKFPLIKVTNGPVPPSSVASSGQEPQIPWGPIAVIGLDTPPSEQETAGFNALPPKSIPEQVRQTEKTELSPGKVASTETNDPYSKMAAIVEAAIEELLVPFGSVQTAKHLLKQTTAENFIKQFLSHADQSADACCAALAKTIRQYSSVPEVRGVSTLELSKGVRGLVYEKLDSILAGIALNESMRPGDLANRRFALKEEANRLRFEKVANYLTAARKLPEQLLDYSCTKCFGQQVDFNRQMALTKDIEKRTGERLQSAVAIVTNLSKEESRNLSTNADEAQHAGMNEEVKTALDLRLARGEISAEEYTKNLELLSKQLVEEPSGGTAGKKGGRAGGWKLWVVIVLLLSVSAGVLKHIYDINQPTTYFNLGVCYAKGIGVAKDEAEAVKWFRKAAERNHAEAQYNLGICYAKGIGVVKDAVEAYKWMRLAAARGDEDAKKAVTVMEYTLTQEQIAEGRRLARNSGIVSGKESLGEATQSAGAKKLSPEAARMELAKLNKDFTPNAFVESAGNGDKLAVDLFLAAGMDVDAKCEKGQYVAGTTALVAACFKGQTEVVNVLLAKGADVKVQVKTQWSTTTALLLACENGYREIAILLLNHYESPAGLGFNEYTASSSLQWAAKNGWTDVVKLLLTKNIDYMVLIEDSDNKTALDYAKEGGHTEIVRLLEQARERFNRKTGSP